MTPAPNLQQLIETFRADANSDNALDQLVTASTAVAELEEVADAALAHFVDQCRRAGHSWSEISRALGVTRQAAHKRFSLAASPTLDRFTERARSALRAGGEVARAFGHNYVGTEHLLLGLFEPAGGLAARMLDEAAITRGTVEERILMLTPRKTPLTGDDPPFTPRANACIERAVSEAIALGHNYVGTEHILLALFGDPDGLAAKILTDLDADHDRFRTRTIEILAGYTKPQA
jgi:hypothetical protein